MKEAGLVSEGTTQRTDSTHVLAAVRDLTRLELVTESVRAAFEEAARTARHLLVGLVDADWGRRYSRPVRLGKNPTQPKTCILAAGDDACRLLEHLQQHRPGYRPSTPQPCGKEPRRCQRERGEDQSAKPAPPVDFHRNDHSGHIELRPSQRALVALLYVRKHDTLAQIAADLRISVGTAHAYVHHVTGPLARKAPGLTRALREADPEHVLVDGTLAECDRVGDGRADYSGKHRRHRVNHQVITGPTGRIVWISKALPGRTHDLTAARAHRIVKHRRATPWCSSPHTQG